MKIAVVGAGIAGVVAARELSRDHEVDVFEASDYVGGHAHTVDVASLGSMIAAETGFLAYNPAAYPLFSQLLDDVGVQSRNVEIDFTVRCAKSGMAYRGGSWGGLLNQRKNLLFPSYHAMLRGLLKFNRRARRLSAAEDSELSLGEFLARGRFGRCFTDHYLLPVVSSVWPIEKQRLLQVPATYVIAFLDNFGLLQLRDRPTCKTVIGGAATYLEKLVAPLRDRIHLNCPVASIHRNPNYVILKFGSRPKIRFDLVIVATHADQALSLLADACRAERKILSSFEYHRHNVVLHTDESVTPPTQETAASWNYLIHEDGQRSVSVTYDLNRLGNVESQQPLFLTVHDNRQVDPAKILDQFSYRRPVFGRRSVLSQRRFDDVNGQYRTFYCGAYWRYGFHEDAVRSALAVTTSVRNWISSRSASTGSRAFRPPSSQVDADPALLANTSLPWSAAGSASGDN